MRRARRGSSEEAAWQLLRRAPSVHLATTTPEGHPLLRTLNAAVWRDWIVFHGAVAGEKNQGLGRAAVVAASETIAQIPSHFVDAVKACPATTYYRSVQAKGVLLELPEEEDKREVLEALMQKLQPEGGYRSFLSSGDFYAKDLKSVRVIGVRVEELTGKESLGQDKPAERTLRVVQGLWDRGASGDLAAIEQILERSPDARPTRFRHGDCSLVVFPARDWAEQHARLLEGQYWRAGVDLLDIQKSIRGSSAWVGALNEDGILVGAARAATDSAWVGRICDVVVRPDLQRRGLGRALCRLLLDHPAVREVRSLRLGTRDQQSLYTRFGFVPVSEAPETGSCEMLRRAPVGEP